MRITILAAAAALLCAGSALAQTTVTSLESGPRPSTNDGTTFTAPTSELRPSGAPTSSATIMERRQRHHRYSVMSVCVR